LTSEEPSVLKARILIAELQGIPAAQASQLPEHFDLRIDGGLDSLGFIRLIAELETRIGNAVSFAEIQPERVTRLAVLAEQVAKYLR
jgi:acyl carrier protein